MKEITIPSCNKSHILDSLANHTRLDGRSFSEFRTLKIDFGKEWGCCHVSQGATQVIAQVSCEVQQPKQSRPSEGLLFINVELSSMAASNFEAGRQSELQVHLNRLLEKCIKESRAVDLESMCLKLNEKVWALRVDVNVLNHEGNILDCASVAALGALAHFRRPDVTTDGETFTIHTYEQKDPLPTVIHHYPVCVTYAIYSAGPVALADPTFLEEGVSDSQIVFAINSFKEICSMHLGGKTMANQMMIIECANKAAKRAIEVVNILKDELKKDNEKRIKRDGDFFNDCFQKLSVLGGAKLEIDEWEIKEKSKSAVKRNKKRKHAEAQAAVYSYGEGSAGIVDDRADFEESDDEVEIVPVKVDPIPLIDVADSGSEEETTVTLKSEMTQ